MKIKVKYFGLLADLTGCSEEVIDAENNLSSRELQELIHNKYPVFKEYEFNLAVNQSILQREAVKLEEKDEIAFLPPYAGG